MPRPTPSIDKLNEIKNRIGTPFHLYDGGGIRENARELARAFSWNAGFKEYFAVKAAPTPALIKLLREEGCGADCASLAELKLAAMCGMSGDEIMFSSNVTPECEYQYAMELGAIINLDDLTQVEYLKKCAGIPKKICLRYNPGGEFKMGNFVMGNPGEAKFGMTREQLSEAVALLKKYGAEEFALHTFLASNTTNDDYYPSIASILFETAVELSREHGVKFFMINLSGGIGIPYLPNERKADIAHIGGLVREAFERIMVPAGMGGAAVVSELGRYMTGPFGWLVATAIHRKDTHRHYIGLDACASDLMRPAIYGAYHHITVAGKENEPADHIYDVTGSLCENNDKFAVARELPKIDIGDIVVLHDTGAHGHSMGYNYNGKLRHAEVLLEGGVNHPAKSADLSGTPEFRVIRRAETLDDYFATIKDYV
ncbi:MAG: diaminopimelate decarboxylase [Oscillospiraceae bacterium]|nr:diaminopimelate decarboxylase [Oscillospiraceae bacterium]